ncbi:MAG: hypothetical protein E6Q44_12065 [Flavobacteriales bacterium]|jgi:hypothetical protein|nr:MAG: hypothetical protein E6Q44_12065 [Flavobacteriales bacterium]
MQPQEQINSFIAEHPEWQRRLMVRFRQLIRMVDPEVIGLMRGGAVAFDHDGPMVSMHAFKTCVSVWFHKGALLKDPQSLFKLTEKDDERAVRKYKVSEGESIDEKAFCDLVKHALKLNAGAMTAEPKGSKKGVSLPAEMESCLKRDEEVWEHWESLSASHRKEYLEWITDAKQDETRKRRIAQALEMIREGSGRKQ